MWASCKHGNETLRSIRDGNFLSGPGPLEFLRKTLFRGVISENTVKWKQGLFVHWNSDKEEWKSYKKIANPHPVRKHNSRHHILSSMWPVKAYTFLVQPTLFTGLLQSGHVNSNWPLFYLVMLYQMLLAVEAEENLNTYINFDKVSEWIVATCVTARIMATLLSWRFRQGAPPKGCTIYQTSRLDKQLNYIFECDNTCKTREISMTIRMGETLKLLRLRRHIQEDNWFFIAVF